MTRPRWWARAVSLLVPAALILTACAGRQEEPPQMESPNRPIDVVLAEHRDSLMSLPGVVGTAIGLCDGQPCIRVLFRDSAAMSRQSVSPRIEGHVVRAEVSGPVRARTDTTAG